MVLLPPFNHLSYKSPRYTYAGHSYASNTYASHTNAGHTHAGSTHADQIAQMKEEHHAVEASLKEEITRLKKALQQSEE